MNTDPDLAVVLWQAASQPVDLGDAARELCGHVGRHAAIDGFWLFRIEGRRCVLAATDVGQPAAARTAIENAAGIRAFIAEGGIHRSQSALVRSSLADIEAIVGGSNIAFGALRRGKTPEGIIAWKLRSDAATWSECKRVLSHALDPLAALLESSRRFDELNELRRKAEAERHAALRRLGRDSLRDEIIGAESGLKAVMERVELVAASDLPVLILGETGSGKEVVARSIHERSNRSGGPFLRVNCGAIPGELIDSQLFGHEKGAFTGASERRAGWFERSDGGTLFLDEIGDLPAAAQVRLLRVLQEGTLERVGGQSPVRVDCRIIAATHRDLPAMTAQRLFREDLWYRIAVFPILVPPLRDRLDDLAALAGHFTRRASMRFGLPPVDLTDNDLARLRGYAWPGNIRELAAVIDRAVLLGEGKHVAVDASLGRPLPSRRVSDSRASQRSDDIQPLEAAIREHIGRALERSRGRVEGTGGAAELLAINPYTLRSKMRKLGIDGKQFKRRD